MALKIVILMNFSITAKSKVYVIESETVCLETGYKLMVAAREVFTFCLLQ
jgi:hypothetical protein